MCKCPKAKRSRQEEREEPESFKEKDRFVETFLLGQQDLVQGRKPQQRLQQQPLLPPHSPLTPASQEQQRISLTVDSVHYNNNHRLHCKQPPASQESSPRFVTPNNKNSFTTMALTASTRNNHQYSSSHTMEDVHGNKRLIVVLEREQQVNGEDMLQQWHNHSGEPSSLLLQPKPGQFSSIGNLVNTTTPWLLAAASATANNTPDALGKDGTAANATSPVLCNNNTSPPTTVLEQRWRELQQVQQQQQASLHNERLSMIGELSPPPATVTNAACVPSENSPEASLAYETNDFLTNEADVSRNESSRKRSHTMLEQTDETHRSRGGAGDNVDGGLFAHTTLKATPAASLVMAEPNEQDETFAQMRSAIQDSEEGEVIQELLMLKEGVVFTDSKMRNEQQATSSQLYDATYAAQPCTENRVQPHESQKTDCTRTDVYAAYNGQLPNLGRPDSHQPFLHQEKESAGYSEQAQPKGTPSLKQPPIHLLVVPQSGLPYVQAFEQGNGAGTNVLLGSRSVDDTYEQVVLATGVTTPPMKDEDGDRKEEVAGMRSYQMGIYNLQQPTYTINHDNYSGEDMYCDDCASHDGISENNDNQRTAKLANCACGSSQCDNDSDTAAVSGKTDHSSSSQCNTRWMKRYEELKEFRTENGHCNVPRGYRENHQLALWVPDQRKLQKQGKLLEERRKLLDQIGFRWSKDRGQKKENGAYQCAVWRKRYEELKNFRRQKGHCNIPQKWPQNQKLANWVSNQRILQSRGELEDDRCRLLDEIGFEWAASGARQGPKLAWADAYNLQWLKRYEELKEFKREHGHCNVPRRYDANEKLGIWVRTQRYWNTLDKLTEDRRRLLEEIGFQWHIHEYARTGIKE